MEWFVGGLIIGLIVGAASQINNQEVGIIDNDTIDLSELEDDDRECIVSQYEYFRSVK